MKKTVVFLYFFHEENNIHLSVGRHFEKCAKSNELHCRMYSVGSALWEAFLLHTVAT